MRSFEPILGQQIKVLRVNMGLALGFIGVLIVAAGTATAALMQASGPQALETLIKVGPGLIMTAIGLIPLKMLVNNRERAAFFAGLLEQVKKSHELPEAERVKLEEVVVASIKEFAKNIS